MNRISRIALSFILIATSFLLSGCGFSSGFVVGASTVGYLAYSKR